MQKATIIIALCVWALMPTQAEPSSGINITISKNSSKSMKVTSRSSYGYTEKSGTEKVYYTITISNRSTAILEDVIVKWKIQKKNGNTYSTSSHSSNITAGDKKIRLNSGQSTTFDTEAIDLSVSKSDTSWGYHSRYGDQIDGCLVKVVQGDKVRAVACEPQEVMDHFASEKSETSKR
ncbi:MAG: hypothetical protein WCG79_01480 [Verrucomicrobiota bacterium]